MTREELRGSRALLREFLSRCRKHLGRKEVHALVETYVAGLLSDTRKRNAEAMALEIGSGRVRALERLLVSAKWNEDAVVRERERHVAELMGSEGGIFVVAGLPRRAFQSAVLREGEKGPIRVEVAALRVWNRRGEVPGREEHLVVVRRSGRKEEMKYVLSNAKAGTPRMEIAYAGLERRTEEQCRVVRTTSRARPGFEQGKDDLGLAQYRTKTWPEWYRHTALVMGAHSFLIAMELGGEKRPGAGDDTAASLGRRAGT